MRWSHLPAYEYRRERWANGLGWTREILRVPADTESGFDWRVSIAEIDHDAPFSRFAGCERELVLLSGKGLRLHVGDSMHVLEPPCGRLRFAGDASVSAALEDGPVRAFNLIWRAGACTATVLVRPLVGPMLFFDQPGIDWLLHLSAGRAALKDTPSCPTLDAGDSLWLRSDGAEPRRLILDGGGQILAVRLEC